MVNRVLVGCFQTSPGGIGRSFFFVRQRRCLRTPAGVSWCPIAPGRRRSDGVLESLRVFSDVKREEEDWKKYGNPRETLKK